MGQDQVYKILKQNKGKWMTAKEISSKLGNDISTSTICTNLCKIRNHEQKKNGKHIVECKELPYKITDGKIRYACIVYRWRG